ncbi:MAG: hypothetical protein JXA22_09815 [Candidatus Thermoplasmatota archaeon]|nr:hypothetical protein [Candidatus Thermoplasmatota archaeon]
MRTSACSILTVAAIILSTILMASASGEPQEVRGDIIVPAETHLTLRGNQTLELRLDGFFVVASAGPLDTVGGLSASLEISGSGWSPRSSQSRWTGVEVQTDYPFQVMLSIGPGAEAGESNSYTLTVTFSNSLTGTILGTASASMFVGIDEVLHDVDDDEDEEIYVVEDDSIPLWPFFIGAIVIGLLIMGVWAKMNIQVVREDDGSRRIYLKERDSGRIIGRKGGPPPEIDL